ncbi:MAG: antibiotic biosynthesis monooxygenase [Deferribacteres bacterium]|nr:antibiotic biosynthesis monooxygenase [candidate division KSB1 bacterium]MCB9500888.1 antibiotic biosynthesis monooxygenase [Deferribacteres bacterium]
MFGLIGKIIALPEKRDELIAILIEGTNDMPGCLSYIVAKDKTDKEAIWITEVWTDSAKHRESLSLPNVQAAIQKGKPLIVSFDTRFETEPVGVNGEYESN